jgi:hypothetical protein
MLSVDFKTTYLYSKLETEGKQTNGEINEKTKHKRQRELILLTISTGMHL